MDFTDGPYYNFTRSQIIAPGVHMIPAPGHTYGNSIVIPEMSEGEHSNAETIFFSPGFVLMMILDVTLG